MVCYETYIVVRQDWSIKLIDGFLASLRRIVEEGAGRFVKSLVASDSSQNAFKMRGKPRSRRIFLQFSCDAQIQQEVSRLISLRKKEGDILGYNLQRCEEFTAFSFPSSERRPVVEASSDKTESHQDDAQTSPNDAASSEAHHVESNS